MLITAFIIIWQLNYKKFARSSLYRSLKNKLNNNHYDKLLLGCINKYLKKIKLIIL